jgi:RNA polymerase sigma factor (sigma-70 family)
MTTESDSILARLGALALSTTPPCRSPPVTAKKAPANRDKLARRAMPMDTGRRGFAETRWSLVLRASGEPTAVSREALAELCRAYRAPLRAFARRLEADPDRAEDLVQGFFARLVEGDILGAADRTRGRFRAFLRAALRNHAINAHDAETAQKRGGGARFVDADLDDLASQAPSHDRLYDRLWARSLLDRALARLGDEQARAGKGALLEALRERLAGDDNGTTLREAAARFGMSEGAVKVALFRLRRRLADLVRAEVAETVARPEDVDAELRELRAAWSDDR